MAPCPPPACTDDLKPSSGCSWLRRLLLTIASAKNLASQICLFGKAKDLLSPDQ